MRDFHSFLVVLGLLYLLSSNSLGQENYWQQHVHYTIDVSLDTENKALTGTETIIYRNNSPDVLDEIYLHLYPNAFKDYNSTLAKEAKAEYRFPRFDPEDNGYIDIKEMRVMRRTEAPDWQNAPLMAYEIDDTILKSRLPDPLPPGGELMIEIVFYEKIRKILGRAGYRGDQYDLAQWYPKLVVYDEKGWHPDKFHMSGEFYGEFGTFDVCITLPYNYIVAATGEVVEGDPGWDWVRVDTSHSSNEWQEEQEKLKEAIEKRKEKGETRTVKLRAEKVHDFAWLASPDFLYERGEWDGIPIHVLYRSYARDGWTKKVVQRGERVLEFLSTKFGRYPYPQLSITHGMLGGGMEYPMLVMNAGPSEMLISHEVGHIYFYGILANDELAEAWMDEGFTTFQERWYQETQYGPMGLDRDEFIQRIPWFARTGPFSSYRESTINSALGYMNSGFYEPIAKYAHKFKGGYGINAYTRGSLFFEMLKYVVGDEMWDKICHEYFNRWKFKHVNEERFRKVAEDVSGMDLAWYFKQWLHDSLLVDYALGKVKKSKQSDGLWKTEVEIKRKARGIMPVEVEVTLLGGHREVKRWDGMDKKGTVVFETDSKPTKVSLDPRDQVLDNNRLNNKTLRLKIFPDFPWLYWYSPRNVYFIRWRPTLWYNDVDGARIGNIFKGDYLGSKYRTTVGLWYGFKSKELDYLLGYNNRTSIRNGMFSYRLSFRKVEGRLRGHIGGTFHLARHWYRLPRYNVDFGLTFWQLLDDREDYVLREFVSDGSDRRLAEWEKGRVSKFYVGFNVNPRGLLWESYFNVRFELADKALGSEFNFAQVSGRFKFRYGSAMGSNLEVRFFGGHTFGRNSPPLQELFFVDGAGPIERFNKYYLRSRGAFPAELHYHQPGDGNLRGYFNQHGDQFLAGRRIISANLEATKFMRIPLLNRLFSLLGMRPAFSGFFDVGSVGKMLDGNSKELYDAGVGIRLHGRLPNYRSYILRFDFPIWLSDPQREEENFKFRWLFSFSQAL